MTCFIILCFDHDPDQRLRAGRSHQNPAVVSQPVRDLLDLLFDLLIIEHDLLVSHMFVDQQLRIDLHFTDRLLQRQAVIIQSLQYQKCCFQTVTEITVTGIDDMT